MSKTKTAPPAHRQGGGNVVKNILGKPSGDFTRTALETYGILPENKALLKRIQALEAEILDKNKWRDYSPEEKAQYVADKIHSIQMQHYEACQAKRAAVAQTFQQKKVQWEKANVPDSATRQINWQRWQAELTMLTKDELSERLNKADNSIDPDFLFATAEYCSRVYPDLVVEVKNAIAETSAAEPWLRDEGIKELSDLAQTYAVEYGQVKLHPEAGGVELIDDIQSLFVEEKNAPDKD